MVMIGIRTVLVKEHVTVFMVFERMTGRRAFRRIGRRCSFFFHCLDVVTVSVAVVTTITLAHASPAFP